MIQQVFILLNSQKDRATIFSLKVVKHDGKKQELSYICLSQECPSRQSHMSFINGLNLMDDGQSFEDFGVKTHLEAAEK